ARPPGLPLAQGEDAPALAARRGDARAPGPVTRLLLLFDVDGTLFLTGDPLAGRALVETLQDRFDVRLPPNAIERVDHEGQTTMRIARLVLDAAGVAAVTIDAGLASWCSEFTTRYLELVADADTSGWQAAPGAAHALERLEEAGHSLAL